MAQSIVHCTHVCPFRQEMHDYVVCAGGRTLEMLKLDDKGLSLATEVCIQKRAALSRYKHAELTISRSDFDRFVRPTVDAYIRDCDVHSIGASEARDFLRDCNLKLEVVGEV